MLLGCLMTGYIGIYLCRKNLSVAIPVIRDHFGVTKAQAGVVASVSTMAYAAGKVFFGPIIDRFGGRLCFLLALAGVALFGALGSMALTLPMLTMLYTGNRFCGAAGWGAMVKQVPDWFPERRLPLAMAFLSLSFVFGGVCALLLAGSIAAWSSDNWRAVMGFPSAVLVAILIVCAIALPKRKMVSNSTATQPIETVSPWKKIQVVMAIPQFWIICGLSFVLTIARETFNDWTVDFFKTEGGSALTNQIAAFLSTPFDAAGALGILFLGAVLQRLGPKGRTRLLFTMLLALAALIYVLPKLAHQKLWLASLAIGLIGFLSYGPYSLLAGILSVEIRGKEYVATVAGFVDSSGYVAGVLAGYCFGHILDQGGYLLGFHLLAGTTVIAAVLSLFLYSTKHPPAGGAAESSAKMSTDTPLNNMVHEKVLA